jgi:hypothetical protein
MVVSTVVLWIQADLQSTAPDQKVQPASLYVGSFS